MQNAVLFVLLATEEACKEIKDCSPDLFEEAELLNACIVFVLGVLTVCGAFVIRLITVGVIVAGLILCGSIGHLGSITVVIVTFGVIVVIIATGYVGRICLLTFTAGGTEKLRHCGLQFHRPR